MQYHYCSHCYCLLYHSYCCYIIFGIITNLILVIISITTITITVIIVITNTTTLIYTITIAFIAVSSISRCYKGLGICSLYYIRAMDAMFATLCVFDSEILNSTSKLGMVKYSLVGKSLSPLSHFSLLCLPPSPSLSLSPPLSVWIIAFLFFFYHL